MPITAPESFIDAEVQASEMIQAYARQAEALRSAMDRIKSVRDELDRMTLPAPQGYASLGTYLATQAAANPTDPVWLGLAGRMAAAKADFEAKRTVVTALATAIGE